MLGFPQVMSRNLGGSRSALRRLSGLFNSDSQLLNRADQVPADFLLTLCRDAG
jgi:hypothetical protein